MIKGRLIRRLPTVAIAAMAVVTMTGLGTLITSAPAGATGSIPTFTCTAIGPNTYGTHFNDAKFNLCVGVASGGYEDAAIQIVNQNSDQPQLRVVLNYQSTTTGYMYAITSPSAAFIPDQPGLAGTWHLSSTTQDWTPGNYVAEIQQNFTIDDPPLPAQWVDVYDFKVYL